VKERRLEPFYHDPCMYPLNFRERGNVDRKTMMGAALTRCLCPNIRNDLWHITYEPGKYGRSPEAEFTSVIVKVSRLYDAFHKNLTVKINEKLVLDRSLLSGPRLPTSDPFSPVFKTRRERENEVNALIKQWVDEYKERTRIGIDIQQLGVVLDLVFSSNGERVAIETMRYVSGVRGSWTIARLRTLGALTTPMELQRYGLVDRGGILLAHHAKPEVIDIAEDIVKVTARIRESSCYFQQAFPILALVDLDKAKLESYDFLRKNWVKREFSLVGLL